MPGATIADDLKLRAEAITGLLAIATGGVHLTRDKRGPISLDGSMYSDVAGVKVLKPCIVISLSTGDAIGVQGARARMRYWRFGCYEKDGYVNTAQMIDLLEDGLDNQVFSLSNGDTYHCNLFGEPIREGQDDTIETGGGKKGASYEAVRFVTVSR